MEEDAVWTRCRSNVQSQCHPGEMSFLDKCYHLVIPNEENAQELVGFSQGEAIAHCQTLGGHLLNVMSQVRFFIFRLKQLFQFWIDCRLKVQ